MTEEFKKARDESANIGLLGVKALDESYIKGANWAYEWYRKQETIFDTYMQDRGEIKAKLDKAVEDLKLHAAYSRDSLTVSMSKKTLKELGESE